MTPPGYDVDDQKIQALLPLTLDPGSRESWRTLLVSGRQAEERSRSNRADVETILQKLPTLNPGVHAPSPEGHRIRLEMSSTISRWRSQNSLVGARARSSCC